MNMAVRSTTLIGFLPVFLAFLSNGGEALARTLHEGSNNGYLSSSDGTSATRSARYADVWTFTLSRRTDVTVSMNSNFDNYLILYGNSTPSSSTKITGDDDSGPGVNAAISWTLEAGTYSVEATSYRSGDTGSYTLDADLGGGEGGGCHGSALGGWDFCSSNCPCGAGEGDCDPGDGECAAGLVCVEDIGADYGFNRGVDVCMQPPDTFYTVETAHFAGNANNSYFFLRIRVTEPQVPQTERPWENSFSSLRVTIDFSGQHVKTMTMAHNLKPGSAGDLVSDLIGVTPTGIVFSALEVLEDVRGIASGLIWPGQELASIEVDVPADSVGGTEFFIWTEGHRSLSLSATAEVVDRWGDSQGTVDGPFEVSLSRAPFRD